ncbi:PQQ-like beta-propeller repeat protein [Prolixibacteraceae bacterium Z1-6]|uniref:PQQ-like beta-propeller repeat protein n=1 Tax=Draconibacterium aestuarii TaxID=2998507 RepID=A0A9X3F6W4_9BACT|nr:PQQ-like beta-propeller repeat protein [Prolixibacteraceae bacterium Z1-6]
MKPTFSLIALFVSILVSAQGIIEFRGVERSGYYSEKGLLKKWPESGPELYRKIEGVGKGFSQPIVVGDTIFISGIKRDTTDILSAYNFAGKLLWETPYGRSWTRSYIDSRSTPTYQDGKLYVSSGTGQLNCVDAKTGNKIWQVDVVKEYAGEIHKHGDAEAPLLVRDLVVFVTGGDTNTMVAFNKNTGNQVWQTKSLGGTKSYASPTVINHHGQEIILVQTAENLIGVNSENGEIFWSYNLFQYHTHENGKGAQTNAPLYHNDEIFVTSGYEHPALMFSLSEDGKSIHLKWKNNILDTHHGGVVLVGKNIYGSNWQNNSRGKWASINWETGETKWEQEWENKGAIITADDMLYLYEEKRGNVALAEPSTDSLKIISNFKVDAGAGPHWAHPAIYNGKLFVRHGDVLLIYNIKN